MAGIEKRLEAGAAEEFESAADALVKRGYLEEIVIEGQPGWSFTKKFLDLVAKHGKAEAMRIAAEEDA